MLQLILSLRRGEPFLGREIQPKPFVYVLFDRSLNGLKRTAKRMKVDVNELNPYRPGGDEAMKSLPKQIENLVLQNEKYKHVKVFFIEGLDMLVPKGKTGDLTEVAKFLDDLQRLAEKYGLTIIATVGSPKMKANEKYQSPRDCIFGSVGWGRKVETILYIEPQAPNNPSSPRQLSILSRNGKDEKLSFRWENGRLVKTDFQARVTAYQRALQWMETTLNPGDEFQLKRVVSALHLNDGTAQSALDKLVGEGRVEKSRHGWYRRPGTVCPAVTRPVPMEPTNEIFRVMLPPD
jgi:hypothetical protein